MNHHRRCALHGPHFLSQEAELRRRVRPSATRAGDRSTLPAAVCGWQSLGGFCPSLLARLSSSSHNWRVPPCATHTLHNGVRFEGFRPHMLFDLTRVGAGSALSCALQKASASTRSSGEPGEFYEVLSDGKRMLSCQSPPCFSLVSALCPRSRWVFSPSRLSPSVSHESSSPPQPRVLTNVKSLPSSA